MRRVSIHGGLLAAVLVMAPRAIRAQPDPDPYVSEELLTELLCDHEIEGRSCGTDYRGVPMVCGYADGCAHATSCLRCYRTSPPGKTGPDPVAPHVARLPETIEQQLERARRERLIKWMAGFSFGGMVLVVAGAAMLAYLLKRREAGRARAFALLAVGVMIGGTARWKHEVEERRLAEAVRAREVQLVPLEAEPLPPGGCFVRSPATEAYEAQTEPSGARARRQGR